MGGTPVSNFISSTVAEICQEQGLQIVRNLVGPYITSRLLDYSAQVDEMIRSRCTCKDAEFAFGI